MGLGSEPLVREMERMDEPNAADLNIETASVDISTENRNLYYDLTMLTTGTSLKLVKGVSGNNGLGGLQTAMSMARRYERTQPGETAGDFAVELRDDCHRDAGQLSLVESEIEEWSSSQGNGWPIPSSCAYWTLRHPRSSVPTFVCTQMQRRPLPQ